MGGWYPWVICPFMYFPTGRTVCLHAVSSSVVFCFIYCIHLFIQGKRTKQIANIAAKIRANETSVLQNETVYGLLEHPKIS